jgi:hypothetical protein
MSTLCHGECGSCALHNFELGRGLKTEKALFLTMTLQVATHERREMSPKSGSSSDVPIDNQLTAGKADYNIK